MATKWAGTTQERQNTGIESQLLQVHQEKSLLGSQISISLTDSLFSSVSIQVRMLLVFVFLKLTLTLLERGSSAGIGLFKKSEFVYSEGGQWKEAENLQVQVKETHLRWLGAEHSDTLTNLAKKY